MVKNMKKKIITMTILTSMLLTGSLSVSAAGNYTDPVNGVSYEYTIPNPEITVTLMNYDKFKDVTFDQAPVIIDGRTPVPMRAIFEALAMAVTWDDSTKTVKAAGGQTDIILTVGDNKLYRNTNNRGNAIFELDVPAQIINGRTLVPLRAIGDALNSTVTWNENTHNILFSGYTI